MINLTQVVLSLYNLAQVVCIYPRQLIITGNKLKKRFLSQVQ